MTRATPGAGGGGPEEPQDDPRSLPSRELRREDRQPPEREEGQEREERVHARGPRLVDEHWIEGHERREEESHA